MILLPIVCGVLVACTSEPIRDEPIEPSEPSEPTEPPEPMLALPLRFEPIELAGEPDDLTDFVFLPNGEEMLVMSKAGSIYHYELLSKDDDETAPVTTELLGSFDLSNVNSETDCGAISLLLDNDFAKNGWFFVSKCTSRRASGVYRYRFDADDYAAIDGSETLIIEAEEPSAQRAWHNVGSLNMDAEGNLWVPFGDKTVNRNAQDPASNLGAIVRIVPNRDPNGAGYEPVADNPFTGEQDKSPDIYAYGVRSPYRAVLDGAGRLWFGDVGSVVAEEINVITRPGQNFGWADAEGTCVTDCTDLTDPVFTWDRSGDHDFIVEDPEAPPINARVAIAGLAYDSSVNDRYGGLLDDRVIYGDMCVGFLRAARYADDHVVSDEYVGHLRTVAALSQRQDGYIYALSLGNCQTDVTREIDTTSRLFRALPTVVEP